MDKRTYKDTEERISLLGFGCMRFPVTSKFTKRIDKQKAEALIAAAYESGVNYYDTAYIYHLGKSETFIGSALSRYPRETFNLADKLPTWLIFSENDVEKYFYKQLEKCKVDYFDYYLIHCLNVRNYKKVKKYRIFEKLEKLKSEGLIRHLGFSFHDTPKLLREIADDYPWDFGQLQINYLDWEQQDAKTQYQILTDRGIPVIVMEPVRGGALVSLCDESVKILKDYNPDASAASWALRYAASLPNVLTVLSGMSDMSHVTDNIKTFTDFKPLTDGEYRIVERALDAYKKTDSVCCTACRYCMDCPFGLDIPKIFNVYNTLMAFGDEAQFLKDYNALANKADACKTCNKCAEHCPQMIKISDVMKKIAKKAEALTDL